MIVFLDTTALASLFLEGEQSSRLKDRIKEERDGVAIAEFSQVEFAAFLRDLRDGGVPKKTIAKILDAYQGTLRDVLILPDDPISATILVARSAIQPSQAVILAAAVNLRSNILRNLMAPSPGSVEPGSLELGVDLKTILFATMDPALRGAAAEEGFPLFPA